MLKLALTKNFREFACRKTAHCVHLPEAVLRSDIALGKKQIFEIGGLNGGHAVVVTGNRDRS